MFSPSLVTMVLHSIWAGSDILPQDNDFEGVGALADRLARDVPALGLTEWPEVPIIARSRNVSIAREYLKHHIRVSHYPDGSGSFYWGRIPVNLLVPFINARHFTPIEEEYVDLGTRVLSHAGSSSLQANCTKLLSSSATGTVSVNVAMVDRGKSSPGRMPNNFGRKLTHAITTDVEMVNHTLMVLTVLLERLNHRGILPATKLFCSLVKPPTSPIGRECFKHANVKEMLDALDDLLACVKSHSEPLVVNMSLGTHVGPHNGDSPLESFIATNFDPSSSRYFHAPAGNDGLSGVAARRKLEADIRDYLHVRTGPARGGELLVEFWWEEPPGGSLKIEALVSKVSGRLVFARPVRINSTRSKTVLTRAAPSIGGILCESLFYTKCRRNMSCAAFALSTTTSSKLPVLDIEFTLESTVKVTVNSWIVVGGGLRAAFIEGGSEGTISVPASSPDVLCVAGVTGVKKPWARSSRGPVGDYGSSAPTLAPRMAHLVHLGRAGKKGTSFACPRAAADSAKALHNLAGASSYSSIDDLACAVLSISSPAPSWNSRTGYGEIV